MLLSSSSLPLAGTDQASLQTFVHRGRANARTLTRARILLKLAEGWTEADLCTAFDVCRNTVVRVRQRYLEGGPEAVNDSSATAKHPREPRLPISLPLPAARSQMATTIGRCECWQARPSNCAAVLIRVCLIR